MNCRHAREAISERMDGERLSARTRDSLDRHLATCRECAAFADASWRLREHTRFRVAAAVPDLIEPIMVKVREEGRVATTAPLRLPVPHPSRRVVTRPVERRPVWRAIAPLVAALLVGIAAGTFAVGGPTRRAPAIAAADIRRGAEARARELDAYRARFAVTEWHFRPSIPVRDFQVGVSFEAPERFRMDVLDRTRYPNRSWTPNDLRLIVNGSRWYSKGPARCPEGSPPTCPPVRKAISERPPFSAAAPLPTDLVLPLGTLDDPRSVTVLGRGRIAGRSAVQVELEFARATPLFPFLRLGGAWRPFFPEDRVVLWLDARNYFPLEYRVFPSADPARRAWEVRNDLPKEGPHDPVFLATATSVDLGAPPPGTFGIPASGPSQRQGARDVALADVRRHTGYRPVLPSDAEGLDLYRVVLPPVAGKRSPEALIAYASGLSWLKVQETTGWTGDAPFGDVGHQAEQVSLPGGGVAYYEPAGQDVGRRLSIHAGGFDLYLETNLPRAELLHVAGSVPVEGAPLPPAWRVHRSADGTTERLALPEAAARQPFPVLLPGRLPSGYGVASAEVVRLPGSTGVNVYYRHRESDLGTGVIRLHEEEAAGLPPASAADQVGVAVRGQDGRYTPERHSLEWVEAGVYVEIDAPGLDLPDLLQLASALEPAPTPAVMGGTP